MSAGSQIRRALKGEWKINKPKAPKAQARMLSPRLAWRTIMPMPEWLKKALTPKALRKVR